MEFQSVTNVVFDLGNGQTEESLRVVTSDNKVLGVPKDTNNRYYQEILKQVADGTLTIQDEE